MKLISVILLSHNQKQYLKNCIDSVLKQSYKKTEIIAIDNNSADGSAEFIKKEYPEIKLVRNIRNEGYARAHNKGIDISNGEYVLPLNIDLVFNENYIEEMIRVIARDGRAGMAQGKLYQMPQGNEHGRIDSLGVYIKKNRQNLDIGYGEEDAGGYNKSTYVFGASGAAPLYKRKMLEDIKIDKEYFDEDFFMYREEVDLAWRAQLAGWKCLYVPAAVAYHSRAYSPDTRKNMPERLRYLQYRNRYLMLIKNELPLTFIVHFFNILLFEIAAFFYMVFREPFLLKAWPDIIRLMPKMLEKRREIMRKKKVSTRYILSMIK